jgi:oligopeptidase B
MKRRLYIPNVLPPLKTVANGYEYYSTTSAYGMVYLRKKLGEGNHAPEVNLKTNRSHSVINLLAK